MTTLPSRERLAAQRVLVVGDVMLDRYWHGAVERISPEAPVPVVRIEREEERLGGAANVALNVRTLGARVTLLTVVGNDEPARRLRELLHERDIATALREDKQLYTIVKLRVIGRAQQLLRVDFENEPDHEALGEMLDDFAAQLPQHDVVLFSDYGKGGLTHIPRMIELARAAGKPVLVDPKGSDYQRYAGASIITPNRGELAQVAGAWKGEAELLKKVDALRADIAVGAVLLTRSEEGMTLFDASGVTHEPARAREVFDVTGAGDTVIATLAVLTGAGMPLPEAMRLANKAGGIVVGKFGTATVSYDELAA
ncbi:D-glycero-beta-D-manno-heptose-7-phosphate kinase [Roseateles saccharophilus]|uniref:D-alpha,beta-D-heptose 7-phosphate 1-kinase n=1 Tax=Roseateles saccharophilus TaxID=304 RepID=A0A4R3V9X3_ROSSA|nr:D-glycero-beta-D-manno-heptose-7-phosphate kinase [Roseateles saccharophilus]MDG0832552.1 D-glycero-beta-D-manno-heptose-7-phosphate kinase [Roseateles saccharophilus]TCV00288.1 D-alpha,beta-D-heptose 7-phosphate 1-kinase [Roseateles saccharophilus]